MQIEIPDNFCIITPGGDKFPRCAITWYAHSGYGPYRLIVYSDLREGDHKIVLEQSSKTGIKHCPVACRHYIENPKNYLDNVDLLTFRDCNAGTVDYGHAHNSLGLALALGDVHVARVSFDKLEVVLESPGELLTWNTGKHLYRIGPDEYPQIRTEDSLGKSIWTTVEAKVGLQALARVICFGVSLQVPVGNALQDETKGSD
jgi:hypothetical protein